MPRNASGTYTLPAGNPVVTGTTISSAWANSTLADLASAMTDSLSRAGNGGMTAPLKLDDGTVALPTLTFGSEITLGLYRAAASDLGVAVGGVKVGSFKAAGFSVVGTLGVTGVLSALSTLELGNASDTTISRIAAGRIAVEGDELARLASVNTFTANTQFSTGAASQVFQVNNTSASGPFTSYSRSGGLFGDIGNGAQFGGGMTLDSLGLMARSGFLLELGSGGTLSLRCSNANVYVVGTIDVGHATDTTLSRVSAGLIAVEGNNIPTVSQAQTISAVYNYTATPTINALSIGYLEIPQNSQSVNYTLVSADNGKHVYHPSGGGAGDTFTIPANASVAYPIGTVLSFVNGDSNTLAIGITTDTMTLAGTVTTGTRTLAQNGIATAIKTTATTWIISGTGLS